MIKAMRDLLTTSGGDGERIPLGLFAKSQQDDADEILEAWSQERGRSIECLLLLGRVHRRLSKMLATGRLSDKTEREIKSLIRLIDSLERDRPSIGS